MKIIRIINSGTSFCSNELNIITAELEKQLKLGLKSDKKKKLLIEIIDIDELEKLNPSSTKRFDIDFNNLKIN